VRKQYTEIAVLYQEARFLIKVLKFLHYEMFTERFFVKVYESNL